MREVVLDTETTGFSPNRGDRIVEIGAVELIDRIPTGRAYHEYVNPQRNVPWGAYRVHGLSYEFLSDKPVFGDIGREFLDFVGNAKLVIHNAGFDMRFLNAELRWIGLPLIPRYRVVDTVAIARRRFPGESCSLDNVCRRLGIDVSARSDRHGALLDSEILAKAYIELVGRRRRR